LTGAKPTTTNDPYTSDQQRSRDLYQINDTDWHEVAFEEINGTSSCKLALHNDWITNHGYNVDGIVNMNLPEMGISGSFRITSIRHIIPQKKPIDEDESDEWEYRPVTGLFTHQSNDVWKITFDSGELLGVTNNHPIYSVSKGDWSLAGHLEIGEEVLAKGGNTRVISMERDLTIQPVYNLEVKDLHNFLVGDSGVVVHNNCWNFWLNKFVGDGKWSMIAIPNTTWSKRLAGANPTIEEIQAMEYLGNLWQEQVTSLTRAFPGIDGVSKSGKIFSLKKAQASTENAINNIAKEIADKANAAVTNNPEKLGGIFDIFGVIESTFHTKSQILAAINNAKVGYPSRFKLFKQIQIIGKDGTTYIDF